MRRLPKFSNDRSAYLTYVQSTASFLSIRLMDLVILDHQPIFPSFLFLLCTYQAFRIDHPYHQSFFSASIIHLPQSIEPVTTLFQLSPHYDTNNTVQFLVCYFRSLSDAKTRKFLPSHPLTPDCSFSIQRAIKDDRQDQIHDDNNHYIKRVFRRD